MGASTPGDVDSIVDAIRQGAKYRHVGVDLIASIARRELARRGSRAETIKQTRNKLHQVAGAYLNAKVRYAAWLDDLAAACQSGDGEQVRHACMRIMRHHASTR